MAHTDPDVALRAARAPLGNAVTPTRLRVTSRTPVTPRPRPAPARRRRVLVIEDNPDTAESVRLLLELTGHEPRVAHTGPEGVEEARCFRPEVVLSDIGLPGLDGYGVARELRRRAETAQVRLIAITGYGSDEDRRRSREAGFDLHLVKPVSPEDLLRALASPEPVAQG